MALANISLDESTLTIEPRGIHKVLSLKGHIAVPLTSIAGVDRELPDSFSVRWGLMNKRVGSHIPGFYVAGVFRPFRGDDKNTTFWLVRHPDKAIRILLRNHKYDAVIVEVDDPAAWVDRIQDVIGGEKIG
jgi:hypothetical protein